MKVADARLHVAEDSSTMRMCVCWILRELGIRHVDEAENGAIAFSMFRRKPYDVVIIDWGMPLVDGLHFLRAVRGGLERRDTPMLLLAGPSEVGSLHQAIGSGATGFVLKPHLNRRSSSKSRTSSRKRERERCALLARGSPAND